MPTAKTLFLKASDSNKRRFLRQKKCIKSLSLISSKYSAIAANLTLCKVTGYTATFNGTVVRHSLDLKVSVYYSTVNTLTVYKNKGKVSVTEFDGEVYTLRLTELSANTTYYYFLEVICDGNTTYSEIRSFRTNSPDSYVDWGDGENVGGDI